LAEGTLRRPASLPGSAGIHSRNGLRFRNQSRSPLDSSLPHIPK